MKKVQIIDQGLGKGMPAYELMIPKDWQFNGAVNVGTAEGGCFGDWFSVVATANSADNSMALQILPQSTWQYTDDPGAQQQMQAQNQSDMKYGMKACPVRAPVRAQDFLRQDMAKKCTSCTFVSVEPFPELAEMVRHQLGLPPAAAGPTPATPALTPPACASLSTMLKGNPRRHGSQRPSLCTSCPAVAARLMIGTPLMS